MTDTVHVRSIRMHYIHGHGSCIPGVHSDWNANNNR